MILNLKNVEFWSQSSKIEEQITLSADVTSSVDIGP